MIVIKVCGFTEKEHVVYGVEAGVDMVGLVFYEGSRRYVDPEKAMDLSSQICRDKAALVGLFVNPDIGRVVGLNHLCKFDYIQLSGCETPEFCREVYLKTGVKVIKTVRVQTGTGNLLDESIGYPEEMVPVLLTDTPGITAWGGTGLSWDYAGAKELSSRRRVMLAGGLNSDNVAYAINLVHPWGVDVSSSVETKGVKDPDKMREFICAVRYADDQNRGNGWDGTGR